MADFVTAFGIRIPAARAAFTMRPVVVGANDDRGDNGTLMSSHTVRKREWEMGVVPNSLVEAEAYRRLLEGDGLHVDFDDATAFSWSGLGPKTATSVTFSASGGKRGGRATVGSGVVLEYALAKVMRQQDGDWAPTKGWTLGVFKKTSVGDGGDGTTFVDHLATGSVAVVRGAAANPAGVSQFRAGVAGSWSMGNWLSVDADGDVGIHGYSNGNVATAYDYDELFFWPFAIPSTLLASWALALATFRASQSMGRLPRVLLSGDALGTDAQPLAVRCRLQRGENQPLATTTGYDKAARADSYDVREV